MPKTFDEICRDAAWLADNARPLMDQIKLAMAPFASLVKQSSGRIPTEKLSLRNWHDIAKCYEKIKDL